MAQDDPTQTPPYRPERVPPRQTPLADPEDFHRLHPELKDPVTAIMSSAFAYRAAKEAKGSPCPICHPGGSHALPTAAVEALDAASRDLPDADAFADLCKTYKLPPTALWRHLVLCPAERQAGVNLAQRIPYNDVARIAEGFARDLVMGLSSNLTKANDILDQIDQRDEPTIALADGYTKLARARAAVLEGVVAAADRRRLIQQAEKIVEAQQSGRAMVEHQSKRKRSIMSALRETDNQNQDML